MQVDQTTYGNTYNSAIEVFQMWNSPPANVFCYPGEDDSNVTTWMGDSLSKGRIRYGRTWRDNFGGLRQAVTFVGLSGHTYSGTLFETYIRAKRVK